MKMKILLGIILACAISFSGCSGKINSDMMKGTSDSSKTEEDLVKEISSEMISFDELGSGVYSALEKEWDAWNAKSEEQKMFSSHMPGNCYKSFDTWAECEEFLGFSISNPLEDCEWLEKGTYVGMPLGFADASRFNVSFYGTNEGKVQWIFVDSGYRDGDIRVTVNTQIFPDTMQENAEETKEPLITEDSGERYVASTAVLTREAVTYSIRVIGEPGMQTQVKETLEKVLLYFAGQTNAEEES